MDWTKIVDWAKLLSPRYLISIALVTGILLFAPDAFLNGFALVPFFAASKPFIALLFLFSVIAVLVQSIESAAQYSVRILEVQKKTKARNDRLRDLTEDEKQVLRPFIQSRQRARYLERSDGVVLVLSNARIISQAGFLAIRGGGQYQIEPWAWDYLNAHPELLDLPSSRVSKHDRALEIRSNSANDNSRLPRH